MRMQKLHRIKEIKIYIYIYIYIYIISENLKRYYYNLHFIKLKHHTLHMYNPLLVFGT